MADSWKSLSFNINFPVQAIQVLDKALAKVTTVINVITKILKIIQMFISAFNSFSSILATFINLVEQQINKISTDIGQAGVFVNVLVPPAFTTTLGSSPDWSKLGTGGFDGFLQRLSVSLYNSSDKNRPVFDKDGIVGGLIFVADTKSLLDFYKAIDFIVGLFDFVDLFPFNTSPPPPKNVRASSGYFNQPDGTQKLGVKIEWDAPPIMGFDSFKVSRSPKSGGTVEEKTVTPTKLVGPKGHEEEGIITSLKIKLATGQWPTTRVVVYEDPNFVGGTTPVPANPITGGGYFIDYNVSSTVSTQYYYVVQTGFPTVNMWGPNSSEVWARTSPTNCINVNSTGVVLHKGNQVELLSVGVGALGQWSSIQINALVPFLAPLITIIDGFLDSLKGSLVTNSKSFSDFIDGIKAKFEKYKNLLEAVSTAIVAIESFFSSAPTIAILNLPAQSGGVDGFMTRVNTAQRPSEGFSNQAGITMGVVFVYGVSYTNPLGGSASGMEAQVKAVGKAFDLLVKIFS